MENLHDFRPRRGKRAAARPLEVAAWVVGVILVAVFAGFKVDAARGRKAALADFERARSSPAAATIAKAPVASARPLSDFVAPDKTLWSSERVQGFQASLSHDFRPPLAVLRVPKIDLEVPVLEGTEEPALNRGVGHIDGTPRPGEPGNVGIAGHRDGFFRGLKDLTAGDVIEMETLSQKLRYRIQSITIVSPQSVEVLEPTAEPALTLVTCYPFYYAGSAPQRFIVRATFDGPVALQATERRSRAP
jgi:sortase A